MNLGTVKAALHKEEVQNFDFFVGVTSSGSGILVSKRQWLALGIWAGSCMTV